MPLPTRHVIPNNVAKKYPGKKHGQEYAESFYQLPGSSNDVARKPVPNSSTDGSNDDNDMSKADDTENLVSCREEAANRILANMIRQIASLSSHAHGVFGR